MGGSSGGGTSTTNTTATPWAGQQPYLTSGFQQAQNWYQNDAPQYYGGSTVAAQSPYTTSAYNMVNNQVTNNPLQSASANQVQSTLNGSYLNGNPYLDQMFQAGTQQINTDYNNMVNGQTSGAEAGGRYGSGMQAFQKNQADQTLAQNLNNLYANTYGQNYEQERQNQINAVNQAAGVQQQGLQNAQTLGQVGSAADQYAQSLVDADINKWNYNQNLPYNMLANYMGLINGNYGSSTSTSTPTSGSNALGNILGAGLTGLGAYNSGAFSDRRLKDNIVKIGTADNGLSLYAFTYKSDQFKKLHIGCMSDEVREVHPEAVREYHGYDFVDYSKALQPVGA